MKNYQFDVIIIGCGPAGATAAGTLARVGLSVLVLETAVYAGAENWSGCVYFAENLAQPDAFGEAAVLSAPFERRLVRRGIYVQNGLDGVGISYQNPDTYRHCYTVLRPVYDPYWAGQIKTHGAMFLPKSTVTSLIRRNGRVVGVETEHGPVYAEVTFIAEGDASHLIRREKLERVKAPRFMQGVKAVFRLPAATIEERFNLSPGEGSANEYLIRNAQTGGQTLPLNIGAFLYTNRDSLSFGYVVPLDNLKEHYRGDHGRLMEWLRAIPNFRMLLGDSVLTAYGTKLIRSGGLRDQPILVEDGLAVGGAATGLGIDLPYPNFTGPASASGLIFARAVRDLLKDGRPITADRLRQSYLEPLRASVYGQNAEFLSAWPDYLENSRTLFGRSADLVCGLSHFLSRPQAPLWHTARFLRGQLTIRAIRELFNDGLTLLGASGLRSAISGGLTASVFGHGISNLFKAPQEPESGFLISIRSIEGRPIEIRTFPWPIRTLIRRLSGGLAEGMKIVYANDGKSLSDKFPRAVRSILDRLRLTDWIALPLFIFYLAILSLGTILQDLFRYYILRNPVEAVLGGPVADYLQAQQNARDLDQVKTVDSMEAKLSTNSYRLDPRSHIRVIWPQELVRHGDLTQSPLWSVCPARVYQYDPPLAGHGLVTVNYENCIKCESCWHAADDQVLWGRHTDHRLIYRPESEAFRNLTDDNNQIPSPHPPREKDEMFLRSISAQELSPDHRKELSALSVSVAAVFRALRAFETSVENLPASADASRREWPQRIGRMALDRLAELHRQLTAVETVEFKSPLGKSNEILKHWSGTLIDDRKDLENHLTAGREFYALSAARRIRDEMIIPFQTFLNEIPRIPERLEGRDRIQPDANLKDKVAALFPDPAIKEWEDSPIPPDACDRLRDLIMEYVDRPIPLIRAVSFASPALGLLAAHSVKSLRILRESRQPSRSDLIAMESRTLSIVQEADGITINGVMELVPLGLSRTLLLLHQDRGWIIPHDQPGLNVIQTPGIGFRAAALHRLEFNGVNVPGPSMAITEEGTLGNVYAAVALGTADYLSRRAVEQAESRVQFSHQMRDTQGRDGIAKLGAVKAMIARIEAWHLLLSTLLKDELKPVRPEVSRIQSDLCATIAALAFGPEPGQMGYDAGQIFGGFAYSEDDLLSRAYRDSALFRYLSPGFGAGERLMGLLQTNGLFYEGMDSDLQTDLNTVRTGPLAETSARFDEILTRWKGLNLMRDGAKAGEAAALLLGIRQVLCHVQGQIEAGRPAEGDAAACAVLVGMAELAVDGVENVRPASPLLPVAAFPERPEIKQVILPKGYEEICNPPADLKSSPYQSGQFLLSVYDSSARFVPEIQLHDPMLRKRWEDCTDWFIKNFWTKSFEGLHIERYVEKIHGIPKGVLYGFKENGYFSTVIPEELDGGGWWKSEYYILTTAAGRYGDAGLLLVIMASTSIGTTPMLLGLEKEIPLATRELEPLARDPRQLGEIGEGLDRLIAGMKRPDPARLKKGFTDLMALVDSRIRQTRVVKYLAANFLKAFYSAGISGQRRDLEGLRRGLIEARSLFEPLAPTVRQAMEELPRRERAHQYFLKKLGHGGISAFALTEPTAGSDTGGVKTTARPMTRTLIPLEDGRYRFYLSADGQTPDEKSSRTLIDADRIRFDDKAGASGWVYELPTGEIVPIQSDEYNYDTDEGLRYYIFKNDKIHFHDIAQIRTREGRPVYDYYELSGAKMWITNGRIATQYCLYAQSPEGVTGFMVDRHAEGLKVGADERKMGQRGSPTNEIAIDQVRVPKECVIGYEGHGQVNALETLNVGRCGLAVASITLMRKLLLEACEQVPASPQRDRLLGEAAAILIGSDSMTFHLIGLFDRHTTESVRMESAIAKYVCSEDLHEVISLIEQAYGPSGLTEQYRVEKIRRDSRILNIYEGTNEVQRFLILKDLVALSKDWEPIPDKPETGPISRLAFWKEVLRVHLKSEVEQLGDTIWMDAVLQPDFFPLAEMAGEIFRLDCLAYRTQWLQEQQNRLGASYTDPLLSLAERAVQRCEHRLSAIDRRFCRDAGRPLKGLYSPEAVAADAALERMGRKTTEEPLLTGPLSRPLRILCLLRRVADPSPSPRLIEGRLAEIVWRLNPSDESALCFAVRLKEKHPASVTVHLAMPGGAGAEEELRWAMGSGADAAYRIDSSEAADRSLFVEAISILEKSGRYDLILTGTESMAGTEPLGPFVAGATGRPYSIASSIKIGMNGQDISIGAVSDSSKIEILPREPVVLALNPSNSSLPITLSRLIQGRLGTINIISILAKGSTDRFAPARTLIQKSRTIHDLAGLTAYLKTYLAGSRALRAEPYSSPINEGPIPTLPAVWTAIEAQQPKVITTLLGAAGFLGRSLDIESYAVILGPEKAWPQLAGLAKARGLTGVVCVPASDLPFSEAGRREWLNKFMGMTHNLRIVCGPHWADTLAQHSGRMKEKGPLLFTDLSEVDRREGLLLYKPAYDGKLRRSVHLTPSQMGTMFMTVSPTADFPSSEPSSRFTAGRSAAMAIPSHSDWFESSAPPTHDDLKTAEVILDVGYGVKNQDGFILTVKLKEVLERLGLTVHLGATRKVTQDLKLLPLSQQIGQTGVRVNPKLILALGISGAPQHMNYIGDRAVIFAFNKDPQAPLMKFNETRPAPIVHPIVGDLFETIPKLIAMLSAG